MSSVSRACDHFALGYDERKNIVRITNLDADGKPLRFPGECHATVVNVYDGRNNVVRKTYLGEK